MFASRGIQNQLPPIEPIQGLPFLNSVLNFDHDVVYNFFGDAFR